MRKLDHAANIGKRFGSWTVLATNTNRRTRYDVRCACGAEKSVDAFSLLSGASQRCNECSNQVRGPRSGHGETCRHTTTPEYNSYRGILDRCLNPNSTAFPHYGGRGITVCQRWQESFENFLADVGRRPAPRYSIDRINVNGNYEPTNCRWADDKTQASNKTTRRVIHAKGKSLSLSEWSKETGLPIGTIHWRLAQGWDADRAVTPNTEGAAA